MAVGPALVPLDRPRVDAGALAVMKEQPILLATTALFWFVPIALGVRALAKDRGLRSYLACGILAPSIAVLALGLRYPLVEERHLVFLAPLLLILAVLGARRSPLPARIVLLGGIVAVHGLGLAAYHAYDVPRVQDALAGGHAYGKEDWRRAVKWVARQTRKGDVVLLHAPAVRFVWDFYDAKGELGALPLPSLDRPCDTQLTSDEIRAGFPTLADAKRVVLVLSHECTPDRSYYRNALSGALSSIADAGFRFDTLVEFPVQWGIRVVVFVRS
jgi:hypothetical protein